MQYALAVVIGALAGILGGMFGIGGGIVIVPALVFLLGFDQLKAQGTSLLVFMVPVAILGFLNYHRAGRTDVAVGLFIALGVLVGSYLGSKISLSLDEVLVRRLFAVLLVVVAIQLFFKR